MRRLKNLAISALITLTGMSGMSYAFTGGVVPLATEDVVEPEPTDDPQAHPTPDPSDAADGPVASEDPAPSAEPSADPVVEPEATPETSDEADDSDEGDDGAKKARSTEGCPEGFTGNHGQFVSQSENKKEAAHSECGKPVKDEPEDDD